jgi:ring-1,2-phenylacetyl-CoA epoxidase subunit PaaA
MKFDEDKKTWQHGPIDWDEFWRVVRGNGPCNRERMEARRTAHEDGAWVREALNAYAEKYEVST